VPEILLSGNHAEIAKWRRQQRLLRTANYRPDLLTRANLTKDDKIYLAKNGFDIIS
jgi:tRNA (guanine37-N1)-methyltransferase